MIVCDAINHHEVIAQAMHFVKSKALPFFARRLLHDALTCSSRSWSVMVSRRRMIEKLS